MTTKNENNKIFIQKNLVKASANNIVAIACDEAKKSNCNQKLGAVITKGRNKIICRGHNDLNRTSYLNNISNCQHAEMNAATKFINSYVRPNHIKVFNALL